MQRFFKLGLLALTTLAISQPTMAQKDRRAEVSPDDDPGVVVAQKDNRAQPDCPSDAISLIFSGAPRSTSILLAQAPQAPKGKDCTNELLLQILRGGRNSVEIKLYSGKDKKNRPDEEDDGEPTYIAGKDGKSSSEQPGEDPVAAQGT